MPAACPNIALLDLDGAVYGGGADQTIHPEELEEVDDTAGERSDPSDGIAEALDLKGAGLNRQLKSGLPRYRQRT